MLWGVQCSIPLVLVQLSKKLNKTKTLITLNIFVAFSIKSLEGFAILDGGATKTVSGFMSAQPVADRYEGTTVETTDVGFKFAGGGTEAACTKICIPHAEFPQGVSVNVVSNESTPFLIGLDVLRVYGLVINYHYNRIYSHILKRYLSLCNSSNGTSCFGNVAERIGTAQWRVKPSRLDTGPYIQGHRRKERFHVSHPYFIFMTRSQNTRTDTLPRARTIC